MPNVKLLVAMTSYILAAGTNIIKNVRQLVSLHSALLTVLEVELKRYRLCANAQSRWLFIHGE
jgi:hypothetical protein